jgi:hypothetical protein
LLNAKPFTNKGEGGFNINRFAKATAVNGGAKIQVDGFKTKKISNYSALIIHANVSAIPCG